jgi:hypothetical protein
MEDKKSAIAEAVRMVMQAVSEADGREMVGRRQPQAVSVDVEAEPKECEACKAGECMDPEHASEDDLSAMMEA